MNTMGKIVVIVLFAIGLVSATVYSIWDKNFKTTTEPVKTMMVSGIITSEKDTFLNDPEFVKVAFENGFTVNTQKWTSDQIVAVKDKTGFGEYNDFVFPSSNQVSDKVKQTFKGSQATTILYSPMVIATRTPIVKILDANGFLINKG